VPLHPRLRANAGARDDVNDVRMILARAPDSGSNFCDHGFPVLFRAFLASMLLTAGCGRFDFASLPDGSGSSIDAPIDAVPDAALPICEPAGCTVASSEADYAATQGVNGWYYGYWWGAVDGDGMYDAATEFREMVAPQGVWNPPDFNPDTQSPDFTWAYLAAWGGHPGFSPMIKLPIRRWISTVSGLASLTVYHAKSDSSGGDGTRLIILADGVEIWRHDVDGFDGVGVTVEIPVLLHVGTKIDMVLHYIGDDAIDTTNFTMIVHAP